MQCLSSDLKAETMSSVTTSSTVQPTSSVLSKNNNGGLCEVRTVVIGDAPKVILSPQVEIQRVVKNNHVALESTSHIEQIPVVINNKSRDLDDAPIVIFKTHRNLDGLNQLHNCDSDQSNHNYSYNQINGEPIETSQSQRQVQVIKDGRFYNKSASVVSVSSSSVPTMRPPPPPPPPKVKGITAEEPSSSIPDLGEYLDYVVFHFFFRGILLKRIKIP